jgi:hypothetical protein
MAEREALQVALDMFRSPSLVRRVKTQPLPKNVLHVIRIAAGESLDVGDNEISSGWDEMEVRAAAVFFLQQVLFDKNADIYRVLGLTSDASFVEVKDHKRSLLKWLHPDRNANKWESVLLPRLLKASDTLLASFGSTASESVGVIVPAGVQPHNALQTRRRSPNFKNSKIPRARKHLYLKAHLLSFAKRVCLVIGALTIIVLSFELFTKSENSKHVLEIARDVLIWIE